MVTLCGCVVQQIEHLHRLRMENVADNEDLTFAPKISDQSDKLVRVSYVVARILLPV